VSFFKAAENPYLGRACHILITKTNIVALNNNKTTTSESREEKPFPD